MQNYLQKLMLGLQQWMTTHMCSYEYARSLLVGMYTHVLRHKGQESRHGLKTSQLKYA